jgi:hypothetical protein
MLIKSDDQDFTFAIMVHSEELEERKITDLLMSELGVTSRKGAYMVYANNVIVIGKNHLYDKNKFSDVKEGWLYYKYSLSVFPVKENLITMDGQILIAQHLLIVLKEMSCLAQLVAEFEL